jgi:hypothetical protein
VLDYLPCQASSVSCEHLFSAGDEVAMKQQAQLRAVWFKELQMMKFAWRNNIRDFAVWNSSKVEKINDEIRQYEDMLVADQDIEEWDNSADFILSRLLILLVYFSTHTRLYITLL